MFKSVPHLSLIYKDVQEQDFSHNLHHSVWNNATPQEMAIFSGWPTYDSSPLMEPEYYKLLRKIILLENSILWKH